MWFWKSYKKQGWCRISGWQREIKAEMEAMMSGPGLPTCPIIFLPNESGKKSKSTFSCHPKSERRDAQDEVRRISKLAKGHDNPNQQMDLFVCMKGCNDRIHAVLWYGIPNDWLIMRQGNCSSFKSIKQYCERRLSMCVTINTLSCFLGLIFKFQLPRLLKPCFSQLSVCARAAPWSSPPPLGKTLAAPSPLTPENGKIDPLAKKSFRLRWSTAKKSN